MLSRRPHRCDQVTAYDERPRSIQRKSGMTNEELDRLEALAAKATAAPWGQRLYHSTVVYSAAIKRDLDDEEGATVCEAGFYGQPDKSDAKYLQCDADAEFIAESRTAIPALVARVRELEALCARMQRRGSPWCVCGGCKAPSAETCDACEEATSEGADQ